MPPAPSFRAEVERCMARVPAGRVTTYGDIAAWVGHPSAARIVGGIAHYGNPELPWHRLVNRHGQLAAGYHGGRRARAQHLLVEGITCTDGVVDHFNTVRWRFGEEAYSE